MIQPTELPLIVMDLGLFHWKLGFLQPVQQAFETVDILLAKEDREILILLPAVEHKYTVEEWLIQQHKPMLAHLVAGFVKVGNVIDRPPLAFVGHNAIPYTTWKTIQNQLLYG